MAFRTGSGGGRRELVLDWMFLVGVLLKGIDGLIELAVGIPLLFVRPDQITGLAQAITAGELAEDPGDLLAHLALAAAGRLDTSSLVITGVYLIVHGVVKLGIVAALVRGSRRAYPWAVGALSVLLVAQVVDLVLKPSIGVALLTALDAAIIWLTVREWRHHRSLRDVIRLRIPFFARRRPE